MRILVKMDVPDPSAASTEKGAEKEKIETLRSDKSQATMANFFQNPQE
jgi:hypothetical protein